ncbi:HNH endonuclease [Chryseobacterium mulctrae]|uniref:HNH endonuclease n=1 Tax=Chryseobacterium mulctrae TaxID=2576777 RepID=UPI0011161DD2|nr:HNH endonuclease [Chryseobacterium mulctrae]
MSRYEAQRKRIFKKYINNINLLKDNQLVSSKKDSYLCPLCLKNYMSMYIDENNFLTLEDAPPKSLGGRANTLTCKKCNNEAGEKIDFHLAERMKELDNKLFLPNTEFKALTNIDGVTLRTTISIDEKGEMSIFHSAKNNNPKILNPIMEKVGKDKIIDFNFLKSRVIPENLEYSILKTAFIILFQKTGYSLIIDKSYDLIREQIFNPAKRIYPENFWGYNTNKMKPGLYFVMNKGLECVMIVFDLTSEKSKRSFTALLPLPNIELDKIITQINNTISISKEIELKIYDGNNDDYINNLNSINKLMSWAYKR